MRRLSSVVYKDFVICIILWYRRFGVGEDLDLVVGLSLVSGIAGRFVLLLRLEYFCLDVGFGFWLVVGGFAGLEWRFGVSVILLFWFSICYCLVDFCYINILVSGNLGLRMSRLVLD